MEGIKHYKALKLFFIALSDTAHHGKYLNNLSLEKLLDPIGLISQFNFFFNKIHMLKNQSGTSLSGLHFICIRNDKLLIMIFK